MPRLMNFMFEIRDVSFVTFATVRTTFSMVFCEHYPSFVEVLGSVVFITLRAIG